MVSLVLLVVENRFRKVWLMFSSKGEVGVFYKYLHLHICFKLFPVMTVNLISLFARLWFSYRSLVALVLVETAKSIKMSTRANYFPPNFAYP